MDYSKGVGWKEREILSRSPGFCAEKNSGDLIPEKSCFLKTFSLEIPLAEAGGGTATGRRWRIFRRPKSRKNRNFQNVSKLHQNL